MTGLGTKAAGYAHAGSYGQVSGAKIYITLGAARLAFGKSRRHGHHGHRRPVHGPVHGHGVAQYGVGTYGAGTYGGTTHRLVPSGPRRGGRGAVHGGCQPTSKVAFAGHGRRARVGGLMCHDRHGRPFVLPGSRHVLFYY